MEKLVKEYVNTFLEHSYNNTTFAYLSLHLILGRCTWQVRIPKKRLWLDGRVSFWYLSPPSSGKSTPYDFMHKIITGIGEPALDVDDTSDAYMIGYHDEDNLYHPGTLDQGGVVHWDEAAMLLGTSQYAEKLKNFLQKALNPIGSEANTCHRAFKSDSVIVNPKCSLYLTSYVPEDIVDRVLGTGLLQRMLILPKTLNTDDRKKNAHVDIDYLGQNPPNSNGEMIEWLTEQFKEIKENYNSKETEFDWEDAKPILKSKADQLLAISSEAPNRIRTLMETFHPRYLDMMYIIAMHHCCIRRDTEVNMDDVNHAYKVISACYTNILSWLEEEPNIDSGKSDEDLWFLDTCQVFRECESEKLGAGELKKKLAEKWERSHATVNQRIQTMKENAEKGGNGLVKVKGKKDARTNYYQIQKVR